jgi:prolyl-tRNA synthetase
MKFKDSDLIGIPLRLVVSGRNKGKIEVKERNKEEVKLLDLESVIKLALNI